MDTIKIELSVTDNNYLDTTLLINNTPVNCYTDPFSFLFYWKESTNRQYNIHYNIVAKDDSEFYPFTCSCGIAGCASIWNGILVKWRKNTVEWRLADKVKDGYNFLDKSFYSFDRKEYVQLVKDVLSFAEANQDVISEYPSRVGDVLEYFKECYTKEYEEINE